MRDDRLLLQDILDAVVVIQKYLPPRAICSTTIRRFNLTFCGIFKSSAKQCSGCRSR